MNGKKKMIHSWNHNVEFFSSINKSCSEPTTHYLPSFFSQDKAIKSPLFQNIPHLTMSPTSRGLFVFFFLPPLIFIPFCLFVQALQWSVGHQVHRKIFFHLVFQMLFCSYTHLSQRLLICGLGYQCNFWISTETSKFKCFTPYFSLFYRDNIMGQPFWMVWKLKLCTIRKYFLPWYGWLLGTLAVSKGHLILRCSPWAGFPRSLESGAERCNSDVSAKVRVKQESEP